MAKDFTLHHHMTTPISVHHHRPVARAIHFLIIALSFLFLVTFSYLFWIAYRDIISSKFAPPTLFLLLALAIGLFFLIIFIVRNETAFGRDLQYLKRKYRIKYEHSFNH